MIFGLELYGTENWLQGEVSRKLYKTYEQKLGNFHQTILGSIDGEDLGLGDESKVDLYNCENSIYIELKNKHNTCNSDALAKDKDSLSKLYHVLPDEIGKRLVGKQTLTEITKCITEECTSNLPKSDKVYFPIRW